MKKINQNILAVIKKGILLLAILFSTVREYAQVYANTQTNGANGLCAGCNIQNPQNAADGNIDTYAMADLTLSLLGANLYQNLSFPLSGNAGEYIELAMADSNLSALNSASLGGVILSTSYKGVSNNDSYNSSQFNITLLSGSIYLIQFQAGVPFDAVQIQFNSGILGALSYLKIYYADHASIPMPITLVSFDAVALEKSVRLDWTTSMEVSNKCFTIERSSDGQTFHSIAEIKGAGNSDRTINYSYTDLEPLEGISYYRLKQTDFNGKYAYFKIVPVNAKASPISFDIYPNPATAENSTISINATSDVTVSVLNPEGRVVLFKHILYEAGVNNSSMALPQLSGPGIYLVVVSSAGETKTSRLVVLN